MGISFTLVSKEGESVCRPRWTYQSFSFLLRHTILCSLHSPGILLLQGLSSSFWGQFVLLCLPQSRLFSLPFHGRAIDEGEFFSMLHWRVFSFLFFPDRRLETHPDPQNICLLVFSSKRTSRLMLHNKEERVFGIIIFITFTLRCRFQNFKQNEIP